MISFTGHLHLDEKQFSRTYHLFTAENWILVMFHVMSLGTWTKTNTTINTLTYIWKGLEAVYND